MEVRLHDCNGMPSTVSPVKSSQTSLNSHVAVWRVHIELFARVYQILVWTYGVVYFMIIWSGSSLNLTPFSMSPFFAVALSEVHQTLLSASPRSDLPALLLLQDHCVLHPAFLATVSLKFRSRFPPTLWPYGLLPH